MSLWRHLWWKRVYFDVKRKFYTACVENKQLKEENKKIDWNENDNDNGNENENENENENGNENENENDNENDNENEKLKKNS